MYGLDPHTGTHDIVIRNNTVHDHGAMGIICSLDCYNVTIENNTVLKVLVQGLCLVETCTIQLLEIILSMMNPNAYFYLSPIITGSTIIK